MASLVRILFSAPSFCHFVFRTHPPRPEGSAGISLLAGNRRARIREERRPRPAPTLLEQQEARVRRAREREQRDRDAEMGDFTSAASVYATSEVDIQQV